MKFCNVGNILFLMYSFCLVNAGFRDNCKKLAVERPKIANQFAKFCFVNINNNASYTLFKHSNIRYNLQEISFQVPSFYSGAILGTKNTEEQLNVTIHNNRAYIFDCVKGYLVKISEKFDILAIYCNNDKYQIKYS